MYVDIYMFETVGVAVGGVVLPRPMYSVGDGCCVNPGADGNMVDLVK